jgi:hypothetical protein
MLSKLSLFELTRTTMNILGHQVPRCVRLFTFLVINGVTLLNLP